MTYYGAHELADSFRTVHITAAPGMMQDGMAAQSTKSAA
jgi:hypothetical protein